MKRIYSLSCKHLKLNKQAIYFKTFLCNQINYCSSIFQSNQPNKYLRNINTYCFRKNFQKKRLIKLEKQLKMNILKWN